MKFLFCKTSFFVEPFCFRRNVLFLTTFFFLQFFCCFLAKPFIWQNFIWQIFGGETSFGKSWFDVVWLRQSFAWFWQVFHWQRQKNTLTNMQTLMNNFFGGTRLFWRTIFGKTSFSVDWRKDIDYTRKGKRERESASDKVILRYHYIKIIMNFWDT